MPDSMAGPLRVVRCTDAIDHVAGHQTMSAGRGVDTGLERTLHGLAGRSPRQCLQQRPGESHQPRYCCQRIARQGNECSAVGQCCELHGVSWTYRDPVDEPPPSQGLDGVAQVVGRAASSATGGDHDIGSGRVQGAPGVFERVGDVGEGDQVSSDRLDPPGKLRRQRIPNAPISWHSFVGELISQDDDRDRRKRNHLDHVVPGGGRKPQGRRRQYLAAGKDALAGAHLLAPTADVVASGRACRPGHHDSLGLCASLAAEDGRLRWGDGSGADPNALAIVEGSWSVTGPSVTHHHPGTSTANRPAIHRCRVEGREVDERVEVFGQHPARERRRAEPLSGDRTHRPSHWHVHAPLATRCPRSHDVLGHTATLSDL